MGRAPGERSRSLRRKRGIGGLAHRIVTGRSDSELLRAFAPRAAANASDPARRAQVGGGELEVLVLVRQVNDVAEAEAMRRSRQALPQSWR
jgi:hypothetical protein